jgi:Glycosyl hydrolase family 76
MIRQTALFFGLVPLILRLGSSVVCAQVAADNTTYPAQAQVVMQSMEQKFYDHESGLYCHSLTERGAEFTWGNGVMFSALVGAARNNPSVYRAPMDHFFQAMDRYWDTKAPVPGYEPAPTHGGNDKYYDDNEWMVLTFTEAYELTGDQRYLRRAEEALKFSLSGWDEQAGGGIWWHVAHKGGSKNTCSNAPAATACLRIAKFLPPAQSQQSVAWGLKIVQWTQDHLEAPDGLFVDSIKVDTGKKNEAKLTYNTALMIRANLGLYRWTGDPKYLREAQRSASAADSLLDKNTGVYRDSIKWSHLMVEADLELYRTTHEDYLLARAKRNVDHAITEWNLHPPDKLIDNASVARLLWLMADTESESGKQFWARADRVPK